VWLAPTLARFGGATAIGIAERARLALAVGRRASSATATAAAPAPTARTALLVERFRRPVGRFAELARVFEGRGTVTLVVVCAAFAAIPAVAQFEIIAAIVAWPFLSAAFQIVANRVAANRIARRRIVATTATAAAASTASSASPPSAALAAFLALAPRLVAAGGFALWLRSTRFLVTAKPEIGSVFDGPPVDRAALRWPLFADTVLDRSLLHGPRLCWPGRLAGRREAEVCVERIPARRLCRAGSRRTFLFGAATGRLLRPRRRRRLASRGGAK
jgi:hypothetical protein